MRGFTYSVVASALHDPASLDALLAPITAELESLDGRRAEAADLELHTPHVIVVATGGTESAVLDLDRTSAKRQGIYTMHRQAQSIDAVLTIISQAEGGTTVTLQKEV